MNFCAVIVILKMEEATFNVAQKQYFWFIMLYYFKKGEHTTETQKKICAMYGKGAVTHRMCQKWFVKFLGTIVAK